MFDFLFLIDNQFRSLFIFAFERLFLSYSEKKKNTNLEILRRLSVRLISSLIGVFIFTSIQKNSSVENFIFTKNSVSILFLFGFIFFLLIHLIEYYFFIKCNTEEEVVEEEEEEEEE